MKIKHKICFAIGVIVLTNFTACNIKSKENVDSGKSVYELKASKKALKKEQEFTNPFVKGKMTYKILEYKENKSLKDAQIEKSSIEEPHNQYAKQEVGEKHRKLEDFVNDDTSMKKDSVFITIKLKISNIDAEGITKKDEFTSYEITLFGGNPVNHYYPVYFSEAGKADKEQKFHYRIKKGETKEVVLGYFVQREDLKTLVGTISNSEIQFKLK
ncbi:hypothetical protein [Lachnobacterium bovis]|uniref:hypothetical protein n=1 Tax=Lachnobacterium bovis TaxID=140626 RepID=UPI0003B38874|nr:hypothetical protein [Lachnobacterium bovis]